MKIKTGLNIKDLSFCITGPVFGWIKAGHFFKSIGKIMGITETKAVGYLRNRLVRFG